MLGFLLPVIIFIAIGGYFGYTISKKKLEDQILASLSLIITTKKDYLETFIDFNKGRVADWSSDGHIRDDFEKIIENKDEAKARELGVYIKTKKQVLDPEIIITDILGTDGVIIISTTSERVGTKEKIDDLDNEYNFTKAKNALFGETFISSVVVEDEPGHMKDVPMWHVSTPLISLKSGKVIGVMVNHISNNKLMGVFKENQRIVAGDEIPEAPSLIVRGSTLEIYLVDARKLMLTPSIFVENAILNQIVDTEPVKRCYETGKNMNGIYNNYRGISVFGASACVDSDSQWTLLAEINESGITTELNDIKIIIVALSIFALLITILLIYFLNKSIVYPIRELSSSIKNITKGQLLQKLEVLSADEIGNLREAFNEMSRRIEEEDRAKSEFVSLASHQLLTPLTTIRWFIETMFSGTANGLSENQKKYLDSIHKIDLNMIDLVRALLDVSRIELGVFSIEPETANIADVINDILSELDPMIKKKMLNIVKSFGQTAPIMNADPKLLRIVLQNLLTNAVKYTPENGTVTFEIKLEDSKIVMKISDTGYGIPKELQEKVFSKFFRGDNIKNREPEGTGLGLYIVKSIIDHSGGEIRFESEENKGTTFYISYPSGGMIKKEGEKRLGQ